MAFQDARGFIEFHFWDLPGLNQFESLKVYYNLDVDSGIPEYFWTDKGGHESFNKIQFSITLES